MGGEDIGAYTGIHVPERVLPKWYKEDLYL